MRRVTVIMAAAAILLTAGCGGTQQPARPRPQTALPQPVSHLAPPRSFRWLVDVSGPAPSVAQENRHPGTRSWRLPGPAADVGGLAWGNVQGYPASEAVRPG